MQARGPRRPLHQILVPSQGGHGIKMREDKTVKEMIKKEMTHDPGPKRWRLMIDNNGGFGNEPQIVTRVSDKREFHCHGP